jgi:2,3-bisphosphoglycerate-independent phosphoglycerate mutase
VGHNALGAGQLIDQGAALVDKALASGSLFEGEGWQYITPAFESNTVHFIGLLSDGGVHSRTDQLYGLVRGAAERGAKRIRWAAAGTRPGTMLLLAGNRAWPRLG